MSRLNHLWPCYTHSDIHIHRLQTPMHIWQLVKTVETEVRVTAPLFIQVVHIHLLMQLGHCLEV